MHKMKNWIIDLDSTIAQYNRKDVEKHGLHHIGDPIPGAVEFVNTLAQSGKIIIYTVRMNYDECNLDTVEKQWNLYQTIANWLNKHGFKWTEIYRGQGKPDGTAFIDDRGVQCRPQENANAYIEALDYINNVILQGK